MIDPLDEAKRRGERAQMILEDEVFTGAFAVLEADLMGAFRRSAVGQADEREAAYRMLRALDSVRAELTRVMVDGRMAVDEVEQRKRDAAIAATAYGF